MTPRAHHVTHDFSFRRRSSEAGSWPIWQVKGAATVQFTVVAAFLARRPMRMVYWLAISRDADFENQGTVANIQAGMSESLCPEGPIVRERHSATPMLQITTKMDGITIVRIEGSSAASATCTTICSRRRGSGALGPRSSRWWLVLGASARRFACCLWCVAVPPRVCPV